MKYLIMFILSCMMLLSAQITPEQNYGGILYNLKLKNGDIKNLLIDYNNNSLMVYNPDHSLYKAIQVPVPSGYAIYYVSILTDKLFDNDDQLEAAVAFSKSDSTGTYYLGRVIEDNGTIVTEVADCYSFAAVGKSSSYKLHCYQAKISNGSYTYSTKVYSVPGSVATVSPEEGERYNIESMSYPNPSNGAVCISYQLPDKSSIGELQLFNTAGQQLAVYQLHDLQGNFMLPTAGLTTGTYFYRLVSGAMSSKFNKLMILK